MKWIVLVLSVLGILGIVFMAQVSSEINAIKYRLEKGLFNTRKATKDTRRKQTNTKRKGKK